MHDYLPVLLVGAIIGAFAIAFVAVYFHIKSKKEAMDFNRNMSDKVIVKRLLGYAKPYWKKFVLVFVIMIVSIVYDLVSPILVGNIEELVKGNFELSQLFTMVGIYAGILIVSMVSM